MKGIKSIFATLLFFSICLAGFSQNNQQNKSNMMQINTLSSLHDSTKSLSVQLLFKGSEGNTRALQLKKDGLLPEHITKTEALLICITGEIVFETENNEKYILKAGEYVHITPNVKHWLKGIQESQLLLLK